MDDGWFRWIVGGISATFAATLGWLGSTLLHQHREHVENMAALDKRLALLEGRPYVDPIEYTRAITKVNESMITLSAKIAEMIATNQAAHAEVRNAMAQLTNQYEALRRDLLTEA